MAKGEVGNRKRQAAKGLATVALLKMYFDSGRDHIDMFVPFLFDTLRSLPNDDFALSDAKTGLLARHGLDVPNVALQTLLMRASRRGAVRREGGRYFRNLSALPDGDLLSAKARVEREHAAVARRFQEFAATKGVRLQTEDEALALLLAFLEQNHVNILLGPDPAESVLSPEILSRREVAIVARFLQDTFRADPQHCDYVLRMLEGLVLHNALLLKDIAAATRKFGELRVFFDTGFLLRALGFMGEPTCVVTRETIDLLKSTNASLSTFQRTVEETKRILAVYQRHLGSTSGILSLRPTEVTRHLLAMKYTPSDVKQAVALLERNISQLGVTIVGYPPREAQYTLDETALSRKLARGDETELEPRVMHDVDCAAAMLTFRAGKSSGVIEDARAVFATTSGSVVKTIAEWYREAGGSGIPPAVHIMGLSNVAWLKKPNLVARLKLHELIALCSAALTPSRRAWDSFLSHLRRLEQSGEMRSDECVAVVANSLTHSRLTEIGEEDADAATVREIVDRVRAQYAAEFETASAQAIAVADQRIQVQERARLTAEAVAKGNEEQKRQLELRIYGRADIVGRFIAGVLFWLTAIIVVAGTAVGLPGLFPQSAWWSLGAWAMVVVVGVGSVINLLWGSSVAAWRRELAGGIARRTRGWLTGSGG